MSTLVSLNNVVKRYQRGKQSVEVLHGVNLSIDQGEFLALMGPSGRAKPRCSISSRAWINPPRAR